MPPNCHDGIERHEILLSTAAHQRVQCGSLLDFPQLPSRPASAV
jgi:hypothetical protein